MFADNKVDLRTIRVFDITLSLLVLAVEPSLVRLPKRGSIEKQRQSCVIIVDIKTGVGWLSCHVHALTCQHQLARVVARDHIK